MAAAEPQWEPRDTIPLGAKRTFQVVRVRDDPDQTPVLVVQDVAERASSTER